MKLTNIILFILLCLFITGGGYQTNPDFIGLWATEETPEYYAEMVVTDYGKFTYFAQQRFTGDSLQAVEMYGTHYATENEDELVFIINNLIIDGTPVLLKTRPEKLFFKLITPKKATLTSGSFNATFQKKGDVPRKKK